MDLRPQAHDIIRTWLFDTVLRAHLEHDSLPWTQRGDLGLGARSRSQEDVEVEGQRRHADGAARGARLRRRALLGGERRPGTDTAFDPSQMKVGRRLAIKLLNASKFALAPAGAAAAPITAPVDRAMLREPRRAGRRRDARLRGLRLRARARSGPRTFFWRFCDDYLELVKGRRYGEQGPEAAASANRALAAALSVLLRLFAPFLPFVTEEVWSWWQQGSIHRAAWPTRSEIESLLAGDAAGPRQRDQQIYEWATDVLFEVRKQRSEAKQPLKVPITRVTITADADAIALDAARAKPTSGRRCACRQFEMRASASRATIVVAGYECASPAAARLDVYRDLVRRALAEDIGGGDVTTDATVPAGRSGRAACSSSSRACVLAGLDVALRSVPAARAAVAGRVREPDGDRVRAGDAIGERRRAGARAARSAERTALNFLQRLSGIATLHAPVRRRRRRPHHDARHAQDDADAARAGEVRRRAPAAPPIIASASSTRF